MSSSQWFLNHKINESLESNKHGKIEGKCERWNKIYVYLENWRGRAETSCKLQMVWILSNKKKLCQQWWCLKFGKSITEIQNVIIIKTIKIMNKMVSKILNKMVSKRLSKMVSKILSKMVSKTLNKIVSKNDE